MDTFFAALRHLLPPYTQTVHMQHFASDNYAGICPEAMAALRRALQDKDLTGYADVETVARDLGL